MTPSPAPAPLHRPSERGQALALVAVVFIALAVFVGLAIDTGILFVNQAFLRRAVDAAALAASSQIREGQSLAQIGRYARQYVKLNNLDPKLVAVQMCTAAGTGLDEYRGSTDSVTLGLPLEPSDTLCAPPRRKQVRVGAAQTVNFTFLGLIGVYSTTVTANAVSEAASIDMVIVIDTSMSMGNNDPRLNDPAQAAAVAAACNAQADVNPEDGTGKCRPLWDTKQAAKDLIQTLYSPYDRVSVVTFDFAPRIVASLTGTPGDRDPTAAGYAGSVYQKINQIQLHIDAPAPSGFSNIPGVGPFYNPVNNLCRTGSTGTCGGIVITDTYSELSTCTGCGLRVGGSLLKFSGRPEAVWVMVFLSDGAVNMSDLPGGPLQSDFGFSVPASYPSGFCQGPLGAGGWRLPFCVAGNFVDPASGSPITYLANPKARQCGVWSQFTSAGQCPPGSVFVGSAGSATVGGTAYYYDVQDYARDMADQMALLVNCRFNGDYLPGRSVLEHCSGSGTDLYNQAEPIYGSPMTIYSIALGRLAANPPNYAGEQLLRYIAAVGDDGDRATDPCTQSGYADGTPLAPQSTCGNYYYAPSGSALAGVFEDIAKKIFTRLTK